MQAKDKNQIEIEREIFYSQTKMLQSSSAQIREDAGHIRWFSQLERDYSHYLKQKAQSLCKKFTEFNTFEIKKDMTLEQIKSWRRELKIKNLETIARSKEVRLMS